MGAKLWLDFARFPCLPRIIISVLCWDIAKCIHKNKQTNKTTKISMGVDEYLQLEGRGVSVGTQARAAAVLGGCQGRIRAVATTSCQESDL